MVFICDRSERNTFYTHSLKTEPKYMVHCRATFREVYQSMTKDSETESTGNGMNRNMMAMFANPSRGARQRSPCTSPVRELARALRRPCSPKLTSQYQTMKDPIISKSRLTMTGGFHDLRPRSSHEIFDDNTTDGIPRRPRSATPPSPSCQENHYGPIPTVVRSDSITSCGSLSPILKQRAKTDIFKDRHLVKIPRKAFQSFIQTLSPRLSKKVFNSPTERAPAQPIWPTVIDTYERGISRSNIENLITPDEPSLTALRASTALEERRNFREALKSFVEKVEQRGDADGYDSGSDDDDDMNDADYVNDYGEQPSTPKLPRKNRSAAHQESPRTQPLESQQRTPSPYPADLLYLEQEIKNIPVSFRDEPLSLALSDVDLDSVPTVEVEELKNGTIAEVRNVHVTFDYIILETGPPVDQYTV